MNWTADLKRRGVNLFIAFDQFVSVLVTLGGAYPDETISSYAYRLDQKRKPWGRILRPTIDWLWFWQDDHCRQAYLSERARYHLPPELREDTHA